MFSLKTNFPSFFRRIDDACSMLNQNGHDDWHHGSDDDESSSSSEDEDDSQYMDECVEFYQYNGNNNHYNYHHMNQDYDDGISQVTYEYDQSVINYNNNNWNDQGDNNTILTYDSRSTMDIGLNSYSSCSASQTLNSYGTTNPLMNDATARKWKMMNSPVLKTKKKSKNRLTSYDNHQSNNASRYNNDEYTKHRESTRALIQSDCSQISANTSNNHEGNKMLKETLKLATSLSTLQHNKSISKSDNSNHVTSHHQQTVEQNVVLSQKSVTHVKRKFSGSQYQISPTGTTRKSIPIATTPTPEDRINITQQTPHIYNSPIKHKDQSINQDRPSSVSQLNSPHWSSTESTNIYRNHNSPYKSQSSPQKYDLVLSTNDSPTCYSTSNKNYHQKSNKNKTSPKSIIPPLDTPQRGKSRSLNRLSMTMEKNVTATHDFDPSFLYNERNRNVHNISNDNSDMKLKVNSNRRERINTILSPNNEFQATAYSCSDIDEEEYKKNIFIADDITDDRSMSVQCVDTCVGKEVGNKCLRDDVIPKDVSNVRQVADESTYVSSSSGEEVLSFLSQSDEVSNEDPQSNNYNARNNRFHMDKADSLTQFMGKREARKHNDTKWYDPESFPSSWKKQIFEPNKTKNPFHFDDDDDDDDKNPRNDMVTSLNEINFGSELPKPAIETSTSKESDYFHHDVSFHEDLELQEDDSCFNFNEIEPSMSLLSKFRKGKLGRFVKRFRFKNRKKNQGSKKRRFFSRNRKNTKQSEEAEEKEETFEETADAMNFYAPLFDEESGVHDDYDSFSLAFSHGVIESRSMSSSAPFDEI